MTEVEMYKKLDQYCKSNSCENCKLKDYRFNCYSGVPRQDLISHYNIVFGAIPKIEDPKTEEAPKDVITHPGHYCYSKYEPKDVIRAWGLNFNLGSTVKYIARAGRKDDIVQDLKKARQFLDFEIEALEEERGATHEQLLETN